MGRVIKGTTPQASGDAKHGVWTSRPYAPRSTPIHAKGALGLSATKRLGEQERTRVGAVRHRQASQLDSTQIVFEPVEHRLGLPLAVGLQRASVFLARVAENDAITRSAFFNGSYVAILPVGCGKNQRHEPNTNARLWASSGMTSRPDSTSRRFSSTRLHRVAASFSLLVRRERRNFWVPTRKTMWNVPSALCSVHDIASHLTF